jgi:hypothetical protein
MPVPVVVLLSKRDFSPFMMRFFPRASHLRAGNSIHNDIVDVTR